MPTDDELLRLYNPKAEHPNPTHVKGLRAVYEAGQNDAAQDYQTRGEYGIGYEHGVLAGIAAEREQLRAAQPSCDGGCNYNTGPEETCSRHGRPVAEVWGIVQQIADERDKAVAEAVAAERERERERCARIAETQEQPIFGDAIQDALVRNGASIAAAIRADREPGRSTE